MKIYANEGKRLTNGVIFGKVIDLGAGDSPDNYHEITDAEYIKMMEVMADGNQTEFNES